jgi:GAF domain-containing protein
MDQSTATGTADTRRLHGLLEAQRVITADLSLVAMLDRIVTAACDLVGAAHGALGVLAPDGSIEHFLHHGLDAETAARLRSGSTLAPVGVTPVRVDDVRTDGESGAEAAGRFAAEDPTIRSLLVVPIRVRGEVFGELYLADPHVGRFEDQDEELVTALAASAGAAIENARLFDQARRGRDWLNASGEITRALLADADDTALAQIVSRALDIAEADYAALLLPQPDGRLQVVLAEGVGAADFQGRVFDPAASRLGKAVLAGRTCRTADLQEWARPQFVNRHDFGPALLAPLVDRSGARGALLLVRRRGRVPFTTDDVQQASSFADQVALALELNDARADAAWLRVLEERHRIAQDLHDNVMQRLFAIGVGLQALADQLAAEPEARLRRHVADLDETIEEIRARVFGLQKGDGGRDRRRRPGMPSAASTGADPGTLRTLSTPQVRPEDPAAARNR